MKVTAFLLLELLALVLARKFPYNKHSIMSKNESMSMKCLTEATEPLRSKFNDIDQYCPHAKIIKENTQENDFLEHCGAVHSRMFRCIRNLYIQYGCNPLDWRNICKISTDSHWTVCKSNEVSAKECCNSVKRFCAESFEIPRNNHVKDATPPQQEFYQESNREPQNHELSKQIIELQQQLFEAQRNQFKKIWQNQLQSNENSFFKYNSDAFQENQEFPQQILEIQKKIWEFQEQEFPNIFQEAQRQFENARHHYPSLLKQEVSDHIFEMQKQMWKIHQQEIPQMFEQVQKQLPTFSQHGYDARSRYG